MPCSSLLEQTGGEEESKGGEGGRRGREESKGKSEGGEEGRRVREESKGGEEERGKQERRGREEREGGEGGRDQSIIPYINDESMINTVTV